MRVSCHSGLHDLEGWVAPDADLDDCFELRCAETFELLRVNGWLFDIEIVDPSEATPLPSRAP